MVIEANGREGKRREGFRLSNSCRLGRSVQVFAAFFARLLKRAGLIKTRAGDLVTLDAHFSGIAQWQNVSRPSWCCRAAARSGRTRRVSMKASPKPALLRAGFPGYRSA